MSVFADYSTYYDLLYKDKDYKSEAEYIHQLIQQNCPGARTLLNLGCGTGKHDIELAKLGYEITGIDISQEMIDIANEQQVPGVVFQQGDVRTLNLNTKFDIVVSLFHVMCYHTSNKDLEDAFNTAYIHLKEGGTFIFDCWYGPAVLTDPPVVRIKRLQNEHIEVMRIAEPVMHYEKNGVDVCYEVRVKDKSTTKESIILEKHEIRYLFLPEISMYSSKVGFLKEKAMKWMSFDQKIKSSDWFIVVVCNK